LASLGQEPPAISLSDRQQDAVVGEEPQQRPVSTFIAACSSLSSSVGAVAFPQPLHPLFHRQASRVGLGERQEVLSGFAGELGCREDLRVLPHTIDHHPVPELVPGRNDTCRVSTLPLRSSPSRHHGQTVPKAGMSRNGLWRVFAAQLVRYSAFTDTTACSSCGSDRPFSPMCRTRGWSSADLRATEVDRKQADTCQLRSTSTCARSRRGPESGMDSRCLWHESVALEVPDAAPRSSPSRVDLDSTGSSGLCLPTCPPNWGSMQAGVGTRRPTNAGGGYGPE